MTMEQAVTFAIEDRAAILTLNRPEKMNALTPAMCEALLEYL